MLNELTQEQLAKLPFYRDKWLKIGLSTEPADRETAERGVDLAYQAVGLPPPRIKLWLRSPFEGCVGAYLLSQVGDQVRSQVRDQVKNQVMAQVRAQVGNQVKNQVVDQVEARVWDQVWDQVWARVWDQVWDQMKDQVGEQVRDQVEDQVRKQVEEPVRDQVGGASYGQHDASWLGFCDFFHMETAITGLEALEGLWLLAQSCSWGWFYKDAVILTERPIFLARDDDHRLHCSDKAAISYSDGFRVYAWHGVRVPEWVIKQPELITVEKIDKEENQEIRRVLLERFGEGRYLEESGAELIHEDRYGKLYRKEIPGDEPLEMVRVENATPESDGSRKIYYLRVPPNTCKTAHEAVAWTFGLTPEQYQPIIET